MLRGKTKSVCNTLTRGKAKKLKTLAKKIVNFGINKIINSNCTDDFVQVLH